MTFRRPLLLLRISFPGRPILYNCLQVQRLDVLLEAGQFEFGREEPIFGPGDTLSGSVSVVIVGTLRFKVGWSLNKGVMIPALK